MASQVRVSDPRKSATAFCRFGAKAKEIFARSKKAKMGGGKGGEKDGAGEEDEDGEGEDGEDEDEDEDEEGEGACQCSALVIDGTSGMHRTLNANAS